MEDVSGSFFGFFSGINFVLMVKVMGGLNMKFFVLIFVVSYLYNM